MRSKQDRHEVPAGTGYAADRSNGPSLSDHTTLWDAHREPLNEYQALMECDFLEEPEPTISREFLDRMETLLDPKELAVINFVVIGGMSYQTAGKYLGAEFPRKGIPTPYSKMAVSNLKHRALGKLRKALEETNG